MSYLESHFGNPRGFVGQVLGTLMAIKNKDRNDWGISLLDVQPNDYVLEIGFGPGAAIQQLSQLAAKGLVAGIDHSETMVQQASRRNATAIRQGRLELKHGSVANLPYEDNTFDKAYASNSHFFWTDPLENLKEVRRVLKPSGLIAICWQPRWAKTEEMMKESANKTVKQLLEAGFHQVKLEFKLMNSVTSICVISVK